MMSTISKILKEILFSFRLHCVAVLYAPELNSYICVRLNSSKLSSRASRESYVPAKRSYSRQQVERTLWRRTGTSPSSLYQLKSVYNESEVIIYFSIVYCDYLRRQSLWKAENYLGMYIVGKCVYAYVKLGQSNLVL